MSRDWRLFLDDILASREEVRRYTAGMDREAFLRDDRTYDAVVRNLEIIGEAARRIPDDARAGMPTISGGRLPGCRAGSPMLISGSTKISSGM